MAPASSKEFLDIQANYWVWFHSENRTWRANNIHSRFIPLSFSQIEWKTINPVDTRRKLNIHKTFRKSPGRLLNVFYTFNLHPVSTEKLTISLKTPIPTRSHSKLIWRWLLLFSLTLSWRRLISYRNQSLDLRSKSMDWFLYDIGLRHERVKSF